jgi:hypothetical protein
MKPGILLVTIIAYLSSIQSQAQEYHPDRVPKQYSFEAGYSFLPGSDFEYIPGSGMSIGFDYAWQLTGLTGKKPKIFISIPLTYTYFFTQEASDSSASMLTYGWRVRHQLTKNRSVTPYLGYYLLLNQLKIYGREGSIMGHQTKFELGLDFNTEKKTFPFIQLEYSMTRFPSLGNKESRWVHSLGVKSGVRF